MSRIALLRKEIQNECEKNKNLQFILQNFENVRDDILDQIDILYDPYSLFTSDSEYSSSEDDILNKSSDSDDAEFFVSQKAKKLAKSASRTKLLSQSTSTDLNHHDSNSIQSPVKKPSINQSRSHSNDNLKKATSSPNISSTNQQNQSPLINNKQTQDVPKIQNLSVRPYGDLKKNVLTQRVIIYDPNKEQQYSTNKKTDQSQLTMQAFQTFLQNMALMKQSQRNQIQQIPNQKTNQVSFQYQQQQQKQKQNTIVPQISIQQNVSKQVQNTINSSEPFKIQPPINSPSVNQQSIQNAFQQKINESNNSKTQLFSPKTPQTLGIQHTTTNVLPMPQFKPPEIKKKQTKTSIQQQDSLKSLNLINFIKINAQQLHDTIIQSAVQVYRQKQVQ